MRFIPIVLLAGCGPPYTIMFPNFESDEIEKVVSSDHSPQSCIENATQLKVSETDRYAP